MAQASLLRRSFPVWMVSVWILGLGACSHCPAPVHGFSPPDSGGSLLDLSQDYYIIRASAGDTYMGLAWEHNVSPYDVLTLNEVRAPYKLKPGDLVRIPAPRIHVVRRGDTLSGIATAYRTDFYDLAQANALNSPYTIFPGQVLRLPSRRPVFKNGHKAPVYAAIRPTAPPEVQSDVPSAPEPQFSSRPAPRPRPAPWEETPPQLETPDAVEPDIIVEAPSDRWETLPRPRPKPPALGGADSPAIAEIRRLTWPVRGRIISEFGPTGNGRHNDGINIAVPERTPVRAADDGVVIYRGNEVPGFGNLILIRHANDLVTAYAHNSEYKVDKGDRVRRGQPIALSGSTGNVDEPQLHFEVRRGVTAVDPKPHLSA